MDSFGVPKKINRHVLKALYYMNDCGIDNPDLSEICELVEISMKNNVPVRDLPGVIRQSLQNMAHLGVIEKIGMNFHVRTANRLPAIPRSPNPKVFRSSNRRNELYRLDPNMKRRRWESEDSISGNEMEKARKRFRSSRPINRSGQPVILPKARTSYKKHIQNADLDQNYIALTHSSNSEETQQHSGCSSNMEFIGKEITPEISQHEQAQTLEKKESESAGSNIVKKDVSTTLKNEPEVNEVVTKELSVSEFKPIAEENASSKEAEKTASKTEADP